MLEKQRIYGKKRKENWHVSRRIKKKDEERKRLSEP